MSTSFNCSGRLRPLLVGSTCGVIEHADCRRVVFNFAAGKTARDLVEPLFFMEYSPKYSFRAFSESSATPKPCIVYPRLANTIAVRLVPRRR